MLISPRLRRTIDPRTTDPISALSFHPNSSHSADAEIPPTPARNRRECCTVGPMLPFQPKPGMLLMCDFDTGFRPPEMVKVRPVVVISPGRKRILIVSC